MNELWVIFYTRNGERKRFNSIFRTKEQASNGAMLLDSDDYKDIELVKYVREKP